MNTKKTLSCGGKRVIDHVVLPPRYRVIQAQSVTETETETEAEAKAAAAAETDTDRPTEAETRRHVPCGAFLPTTTVPRSRRCQTSLTV